MARKKQKSSKKQQQQQQRDRKVYNDAKQPGSFGGIAPVARALKQKRDNV